ncbi:aspartate--ammonia ligase, partial [Gemmiger formicilis]|nr:aspartate--ammonia ligase [Gemmiger formicilis]
MSNVTIPNNYKSLLGLYDTQKAIGLIKTIFQEKLCLALHLKRVTAPLFVLHGSGLNDDLNGVERPVAFDVPCLDEKAEIVHSLAKWKRYALYKYGFRPGQGLVTDMNAVRRDEELDNLHSIYVDQWDWERVITARQRTTAFLQDTVRDIVDAVCATSDELRWKFPALKKIHLTREVTFITTQ